ncbi:MULTISPECIES: hypothetical protein [Acinetobacter]|uniref:Uncharacterized protein n=1 Tax=Acinetobacter entericus TaxID=2989714 RepID=A0ABT3NNZ6_9GAMM|nr:MULTISPECIES: hypothetical protein [Acinetobacter]MCW8041284.1 hypothetical protein [Acinetobacter entericus]
MSKRKYLIIHKVRRINRVWCVGYDCGGFWHLLEQVKTRSEANELADHFDDALNGLLE